MRRGRRRLQRARPLHPLHPHQPGAGPRSALELAAALGTSASVTTTAINALDRCGVLTRTGDVLGLTPTGRAYADEMHPEDSLSVVNPRAVAEFDAIVAHAIATQPVSVFTLAPGSRPKRPA